MSAAGVPLLLVQLHTHTVLWALTLIQGTLITMRGLLFFVRSLRLAPLLPICLGTQFCFAATTASCRAGSVDESECLVSHVLELKSNSQFQEAIPLAKRLVALRERTMGLEHPQTIQALAVLGFLLDYGGLHEEAESTYLRAVAAADRTADLSAAHANAYQSLAILYDRQGRFELAEPLYHRALQIARSLPGNEMNEARILINLSDHFLQRGDLRLVELPLTQALALLDYEPGVLDEHVVLALAPLAAFYAMKGDFAEAAELQRQVLWMRRHRDPQNIDTARALHALASTLRASRDFTAAERYYWEALQIFSDSVGSESTEALAVQQELGSLFIERGDLIRAEEMLKRVRDVYAKQGARASQYVPIELAVIYYSTGRADEAELLLQNEYDKSLASFGETNLRTAHVLEELGIFHREQQKYGLAEKELRESLRVYQALLGADNVMTGGSHTALARLYRAMGRIADAFVHYERARDVFVRALGPEHEMTGVVTRGLALLHLARHEDDVALDLLTRAAKIRDAQVASTLRGGSEFQKRAFLNTLKRDTAELISVHTYFAPKESQGVELALLSVLKRKGLLVEMLSSQLKTVRDLGGSVDELRSLRAELARLTRVGPRDESGEEFQSRLVKLWREADALSGAISLIASASANSVAPVTFESIRSRMPANAALIEYVAYHPVRSLAVDTITTPEHYVAYVLGKSGEPVWVELGEAGPINQLVRDVRSEMSNRRNRGVIRPIEHARSNRGQRLISDDSGSESRYGEAANQLYRTIVRPIERALNGRRHLLISPDSDLNMIPFGALVDDDGKYLIERFEVSYLTSGRDLLNFEAAAVSHGQIVIFADPDYGDVQRDKNPGELDLVFDRLEGTAVEARLLQSLMKVPAEAVLTGKAATEFALKSTRRPRILHLATHGFFVAGPQAKTERQGPVLDVVSEVEWGLPALLGEHALVRSGVALANANEYADGGDDGILTALEASDLDLTGTQLVVLSACETGLGDSPAGEGVYGLRRALTLAGASAQLLTLWKVDDGVTSDVMLGVYERLRGGMGPSAAVRAVQRRMIADHVHPFYWGAFIASGNWRPIEW